MSNLMSSLSKPSDNIRPQTLETLIKFIFTCSLIIFSSHTLTDFLSEY